LQRKHSTYSKLPEELLTKVEIERMTEAARTPRNRAFVSVLYESGLRIGEMLSLKIKNVQLEEHGTILTVNGKNGIRRVRITSSFQKLANWMKIHPFREDPNSPLWISLRTRNRDKTLKGKTVNALLKDLAKKAGIEKRIYPHLFRHSRAVHLSKYLTEAQMKELFGWV